MIKGKLVQRHVVILEMDYDLAYSLKEYLQNGREGEYGEDTEMRQQIFDAIPIDLGAIPVLDAEVHPTIATMLADMQGEIEG
jgi:hypothetical protein